MTVNRQRTSPRGRQDGRLAKPLGVIALAAVYWLSVRRMFHQWGTTPAGIGAAG